MQQESFRFIFFFFRTKLMDFCCQAAFTAVPVCTHYEYLSGAVLQSIYQNETYQLHQEDVTKRTENTFRSGNFRFFSQ